MVNPLQASQNQMLQALTQAQPDPLMSAEGSLLNVLRPSAVPTEREQFQQAASRWVPFGTGFDVLVQQEAEKAERASQRNIDNSLKLMEIMQKQAERGDKNMKDTLEIFTKLGISDPQKISEMMSHFQEVGVTGFPDMMSKGFQYAAQKGWKPTPSLKGLKESLEVQKMLREEGKEASYQKQMNKLGNYVLSSGLQAPDPQFAKEAREKATAQANLEKAVNDLRALVLEHGKEVWFGRVHNRMKSILTDIRNAERAIGETGVLNVGEVPFLEEAYGGFDPTKASLLGKAEIIADLDDYFLRRSAAFDTAMGTMGYARSKASPGIFEGRTATGPNGEKIIMKGGQWQQM